MNKLNSDNDVNDIIDITTSPELENLRSQILDIERKLSELGMNPRRGLESYSINELKKIFRNIKDKEKLKKLLLELIELQERLYHTLYTLAGLKELNVDTDIPERKLLLIKKWVLTGESSERLRLTSESKQLVAIKGLADLLASVEDDEECLRRVESLLRNVYKRDYDRYRVLKLVIDACIKHGHLSREKIEEAGNSLRKLILLLLECRKVIGAYRLSEFIKSIGEKL